MRARAWTVFLLGLLGCSDAGEKSEPDAAGDVGNGPGVGPGGPPSSATSGPADGGSTVLGDGSSGTGADGGLTCTAGKPLKTALVVSSMPVAGTGNIMGKLSAVLSPTPTGTVVGWGMPNGSGKYTLTRLDADDQREGADLVLDGHAPLAIVASASDYALLVPAGTDLLKFVKMTHAGASLANVTLLGGTDHSVVGAEWFRSAATTGRMVPTPNGYAAYFALHRRWPDGIGHQGDTFRLLDTNGVKQPGGWGWGCSHSLDQRLVYNGTTRAAICLSDGFPSKGIHFNHNKGLISSEPGGCDTCVDADLGGIVPAPGGGFWFSYVSKTANPNNPDKDVALVKLSDSGKVLSRTWLTSEPGEERAAQLAAFEGGLLAAYQRDGKSFLMRLDANGAPVGVAEEVAVHLHPRSEPVTLANGDVVWSYIENGMLKLARVRACVP